MASFGFSKTAMVSLVLVFFLLAPSIAVAGARPSPVKCIHHHASLTACARYLHDKVPEEQQLSRPTQACCSNYNEIFRSGTPGCLCRYLHPEKLMTSFNVTRLMSLHDLCPSSNAIPLYDLCVGLGYPDGKFNGIIGVLERDIDNLRLRHSSVQI